QHGWQLRPLQSAGDARRIRLGALAHRAGRGLWRLKKSMEADFFGERARREVASAVRDVEARTAAEVVVAVRHASARYRQVDWLVGSLLGFGVLLILLFHPHPFAVVTMPLDVLAVFAVGFAASAHSPTLRRLFSSPKLRREEVRRAARSAFVELGVSRTSGRGGVLVYVSL